jgi:hypothetical protein
VTLSEFLKSLGDSLKDIIDRIAANLLPISACISIMSWLCLLLPPNVLRFMAIDLLLLEHLPLVGASAYVSTIVFAFVLIAKLIAAAARKRAQSQRLKNLSKAEKQALKKFLDTDSSATPFSLYDGIPFALVDKVLLKRADSLSNRENEQDFVIEPWVLEAIRKDPSIVT